MNAPTGRNRSVSVSESAMAASDFPNSRAMAVSVITTRKKSNASSVQPRNPATTAARWSAAAAVGAAEADGNACDNGCALGVARRLGAGWVAKGTISNLSNLVWLFSAELLDATTGQLVLGDSYEIKGEAARMAPVGAHRFAQRVEQTIAAKLR